VGTRRLLLSVGTGVVAFSLLSVDANEPSHPGSLVGLVLMLAIAFLIWPGRIDRVRGAAVGAAACALALVKINVGILAFAALGFAFVWSDQRQPRFTRALVTTALLLIPTALMATRLAESTVLRYWIVVEAAVVATLIAALHVRQPTDQRTIRGFVLGVVVTAAVILAGVFLTGTSLSGLAAGVLWIPLAATGEYVVDLDLSDVGLASVILGLAGAVALAGLRHRIPDRVAAVVILLSGLAVWVTVAVSGPFQHPPFGTPALIWVGLSVSWMPLLLAPDAKRDVALLALIALAVLQALHAYPVAGSQLAWAALPFVPLGALAIDRALTRLASTEVTDRILRNIGLTAVAGVVAWAAGGAAIALADDAKAYRAGQPAPFPGAAGVSVDQSMIDTVAWLEGELHGRCRTFLTYPGMNDLHFFTETEPPTHRNASHWMTLFDTSTQQEIVDEIRNRNDVCVVRNPSQIEFWMQGRPVPLRPLVRFIETGFETVAEAYGLEVMVPTRA
jgi:hypothetical protein